MSALLGALLASAMGAASPASSPAASSAKSSTADELARLDGHEVVISADRQSYVIADIAGEGPPRVGVVVREGAHLILATATERLMLVGPLAIPRIAGPGYKVWVLGEATAEGSLTIRRIGVLAAPRR